MKFKSAKSYRAVTDNGTHFLITYDYGAGCRGRYTTLKWRLGKKATIIGRELTLGYSKRLCGESLRWHPIK